MPRLSPEVARLRPRLLVVDTFAKVRLPATRRDEANAYQSDHGFVGGLKRLADDQAVSVVCVHHTSKAPRSEPVDEVSGTLGLSGAVDSILVLKRERRQSDATHFLTGRGVDESEIAITADVAGRVWQSHGDADAHRLSRERRDVLDALRAHADGLRPAELADLLSNPAGAVRVLLLRIKEAGQVEERGARYAAPAGVTR